MFALGSAQAVVFFGLGIIALVVQVVALIDGARRRADAYVAAGKMTKQRWMIILAVAAAIGFISFNGSFLSPLNFLNVAAVAAAGIYLADVRPALQRVQGGGRGGRGGHDGPYGPW
ncbi:DUF2516 family protein [Angustibacter peucedani]